MHLIRRSLFTLWGFIINIHTGPGSIVAALLPAMVWLGHNVGEHVQGSGLGVLNLPNGPADGSEFRWVSFKFVVSLGHGPLSWGGMGIYCLGWWDGGNGLWGKAERNVSVVF